VEESSYNESSCEERQDADHSASTSQRGLLSAERRAQLQAVFLKARVSAPLPLNLKAIKRDGYLGHRA
jgi:hypothetical protein